MHRQMRPGFFECCSLARLFCELKGHLAIPFLILLQMRDWGGGGLAQGYPVVVTSGCLLFPPYLLVGKKN